jgi:hypothetical protein
MLPALLPAVAAALVLQPPAAAAAPLSAAQSQALVQRTLATEVRLAQDPAHPMRFQLRKASPRLITTKLIAESRDGAVARLIRVNDQPLSPADEQKEADRLRDLLSDPSRQNHRKHSEDADAAIVLKLLRMLPNAFLYQDAGPAATPGVERFSFRPNPGFNPPDMESQSLTSLTGELWIATAEERVTHLEGHLQQDTSYGWGVLGKLDKGGWVALDQAEVAPHQWRIVRLRLKMNLRILWKNKDFDTTEEMSSYSAIPVGLDYRQAIHILRGQ